MGTHDRCTYDCGGTDCDAPQRYTEVTGTGPQTHKQKMLDILHELDVWHDCLAKAGFNKKTKQMHRKYQQAIWWAIQNLDDESVDLSIDSEGKVEIK